MQLRTYQDFNSQANPMIEIELEVIHISIETDVTSTTYTLSILMRFDTEFNHRVT